MHREGLKFKLMQFEKFHKAYPLKEGCLDLFGGNYGSNSHGQCNSQITIIENMMTITGICS